MPVQVLRSLPAVTDISPAWSELARECGALHFSEPFWCTAWWRHLGNGELHVAYVEADGQIVALAPLFRRRRMGVDTLRLLGSDIIGVGEVLVAPGHFAAGEELWRSLFREPRSVLELRNHRLGGNAVETLRRMGNDGWTGEIGPSCPTVTVAGSWDDYFASRGKQLRYELRRADRRAEQENAALRVEHATSWGGIEQLLPDVTAVFDAAEQAKTKMHFFAGAARDFTLDMFRHATEQARFALFVVYLDERPIATAFAMRCGTTMYGGGLRFDPDFGRFSPGHVVVRARFEYTFGSGATLFDTGPGYFPYKLQWSTGTYDTVKITAASSPAVKAMDGLKDTLLSSNLIRRLAP